MYASIYYIPDAHDTDSYVTDGTHVYQQVRSLTGLDGKRKKKRRIRVRKFFRKVGKGIKKAGKITLKVVKKVIPIASTVATFIPVVGWAAKAGLTAAEIAINIADNRKKKRRENHPPPVQPINTPTGILINHTYNNNNDTKNVYVSYKKQGDYTNVRPNKSITVRPDFSQKRITALLNTIDELPKGVSAQTVENQTKEQMRIEKQNIFNDVLQLLLN